MDNAERVENRRGNREWTMQRGWKYGAQVSQRIKTKHKIQPRKKDEQCTPHPITGG
jgi:hypothetical protein